LQLVGVGLRVVKVRGEEFVPSDDELFGGDLGHVDLDDPQAVVRRVGGDGLASTPAAAVVASSGGRTAPCKAVTVFLPQHGEECSSGNVAGQVLDRLAIKEGRLPGQRRPPLQETPLALAQIRLDVSVASLVFGNDVASRDDLNLQVRVRQKEAKLNLAVMTKIRMFAPAWWKLQRTQLEI